MNPQILFTNEVAKAIDCIVEELNPSNTFILTDTNTNQLVLSLLTDSTTIAVASMISIDAGEANKNIESLAHVWKHLSENNANRNSLLINIGGGMITDLGGFAAATFKRGIRFINVPTTPLAAVDAAVGGKTGINFLGLKNEIGCFRSADAVIISSIFFSTLGREERFSGYAEMLKHALLKDEYSVKKLIDFDIQTCDVAAILDLIRESVNIKENIVNEDPTEKGIRKALNFGHTIGHAFESLAMTRNSPIPHGYAVAYGIIVELILSHFKFKFPGNILQQFASFIKQTYGAFIISCNDYPTLLEYMHHDKKNNNANCINFTLLRTPGVVEINNYINDEEVKQALDLYRDLLGV